jgi:hypothetical protein
MENGVPKAALGFYSAPISGDFQFFLALIYDLIILLL